jgi:L-seryl-tRNA(Ser) seleniumtransferase
MRRLPSVHRLVEAVAAFEPDGAAARPLVVEAARAVLDRHRDRLGRGGAGASFEALAEEVRECVVRDARPALAPAINATGIIVHTGLGRSPMADVAVRAAAEAAARYVPVELDVESGERGQRSRVVRQLLGQLTGAESATVVNNNAAAMLIVLGTVAPGRSVIVSRGELIEIGGSYRLPDIMQAGGAVLREVGTTNRTRLGDYETAIDETTAALMTVHTSNYRVVGFTESASLAELVALGRRHGLPVIDDIGSGALGATPDVPALAEEPTVRASIEAGADLVLFSGDKLLGGPQSGIIVGRADLVAAIERHPMMRAMRVDKVTLAALEATLRLHRDPDEAKRSLPVQRMMRLPLAELEARGRAIVDALARHGALGSVRLEHDSAFVGGGSVPTQAIPSVAIALVPRSISEGELARRLRTGAPAIFPRVRDGAVHLDLRTVFPEQDEAVIEAVGRRLEG